MITHAFKFSALPPPRQRGSVAEFVDQRLLSGMTEQAAG
jgi:hypothetical protein